MELNRQSIHLQATGIARSLVNHLLVCSECEPKLDDNGDLVGFCLLSQPLLRDFCMLFRALREIDWAIADNDLPGRSDFPNH